MNELSIAQEYLLCTLNEKGKLPALNTEVPVCLTAGAILELMVEGCIAIENKKACVKKPLPQKLFYLQTLYDYVAEKPQTLSKIAEEYNFTFLDKRLNTLLDDVGATLIQGGYAQSQQGGTFKKKDLVIPKKDAVEKVVQKIRAELLETGKMSEEVVALVCLLEKSGQIKRYFSAYEKKALKERLAEIKKDENNKVIGELVDTINDMMTVMIVIAATV